MWFWSVSWSTNCPVYFSFFLVDQKKIVQSQRPDKKILGSLWIFSVSLSIKGWTKKWETDQIFFVRSLRLDNFVVVDQKKWKIDRTIGRPRDWPKVHGRRYSAKHLALTWFSYIGILCCSFFSIVKRWRRARLRVPKVKNLHQWCS